MKKDAAFALGIKMRKDGATWEEIAEALEEAGYKSALTKRPLSSIGARHFLLHHVPGSGSKTAASRRKSKAAAALPVKPKSKQDKPKEDTTLSLIKMVVTNNNVSDRERIEMVKQIMSGAGVKHES